MSAAVSRYRIRQVFGSRKNSGASEFGLNVPALLVYDDGRAVDVFSHPEGEGYVTIRDCVDGLSAS